ILVPSRGEKLSSQLTNPPATASGPPPMHLQSVQDHNFYLQCVMEIQRSIGELKTGLEAVAKSSEKHGAKIDSLNETVHTAKGFLKAITIIGSIFGAVGLALLAAIFKTLGDYLSKH